MEFVESFTAENRLSNIRNRFDADAASTKFLVPP